MPRAVRRALVAATHDTTTRVTPGPEAKGAFGGVTAPPTEVTWTELMRWQKLVNMVSGGIVLTLKKGPTREQLLDWQAKCEQVASEIRAVI